MGDFVAAIFVSRLPLAIVAKHARAARHLKRHPVVVRLKSRVRLHLENARDQRLICAAKQQSDKQTAVEYYKTMIIGLNRYLASDFSAGFSFGSSFFFSETFFNFSAFGFSFDSPSLESPSLDSTFAAT